MPNKSAANAPDAADAKDFDLGDTYSPAPSTAAAPAAAGGYRMQDEDTNPFEPEVAYTEPEGARQPEWNGRPTQIPLGYPVLRSHQIVGPGTECIDCKRAGKPGKRDHQFHLKISKINGQWVGPDVVEYELLKHVGVIAGTREHEQRREDQAAIDYARGVKPDPMDPVNKPGMPELAARSTQDQIKFWNRELAGGPQEVVRRERQQARSDAAELSTELLKTMNLIRAMTGQPLLSEVPAEWAGAQGPGTHPIAQAAAQASS